MTKDVRNLINICRRFLDGEINGEEFVQLFDDAFYEVPDENFLSVELDIMSNIFDDNEMFEPNDLIREEDELYIDEAELRRRTQINIDKLNAII